MITRQLLPSRARGKVDIWYGRLVYALSGVAPGWWIIVVATVASSTYYVSQVQPIEEAGRQLRHDAATLVRSPLPNEIEVANPAAQLADFYATFPHVQELPGAMQTLYDAVQAEGLTLEQASYKLVRNSSDRFVRYEMALPIRGAYPQVKRFLAKVTAALPTLVVEQMQLSRTQAADAIVDCRLSLAIYLIDGLPKR